MASNGSIKKSQSFETASLWVLTFSNGDRPCEFTIYAFTASQARRKLKATLRQYREEKKSIRTFEGPFTGGLQSVLNSTELGAPNNDGSKWCEYENVDEMIENAFLSRQDYRDVSFHCALDG